MAYLSAGDMWSVVIESASFSRQWATRMSWTGGSGTSVGSPLK